MIKKTVHYKKAQGNSLHKHNLQKKLSDYYDDHTIVHKRSISLHLEAEIGYELVLNKVKKDGMFFGELMLISKDIQKKLRPSDDKTHYIIENTEGTNTYSSRDIIYFGVYENHVIYSQSTLLRSNRLTYYFSQILEDDTLALQSDIKHTVAKYASVTGEQIKEYRIDTTLPSQEEGELIFQDPVEEREGLGTSIMKNLFSLDKRMPQETLKQKNNLNISVVLSYKNNQAGSTTDIFRNLIDLTTNLEEDNNAKWSIKLVGGALINDNQIVIKNTVPIDDGSHDQIFDRMCKAIIRCFYDWIEADYIAVVKDEAEH